MFANGRMHYGLVSCSIFVVSHNTITSIMHECCSICDICQFYYTFWPSGRVRLLTYYTRYASWSFTLSAEQVKYLYDILCRCLRCRLVSTFMLCRSPGYLYFLLLSSSNLQKHEPWSLFTFKSWNNDICFTIFYVLSYFVQDVSWDFARYRPTPIPIGDINNYSSS